MKKVWQFVRRYQYWILLGLILIAMLFSLFNRRSGSPETVATRSPLPTASTTGQFTASPEERQQPSDGTLTQLANHPFPSAALDVKTKTIYYHDFDGDALKRYSLRDGSEKAVAAASVYLTKARWSPDFTTLIVEALNEVGRVGTNPFFSETRPFGDSITGAYNLGINRFTPLNPSSKQIAYINPREIIYQFDDGSHNNLSISQVDGGGWKNISVLKGSVALRNAGDTALLQVANQSKVTRYGAGGKVIETIEVPADLKLNQSSWTGSGRQALYWVGDGAEVAIKQLRSKTEATVATVSIATEDLVILWDNETGEVYLANFDGLYKLNIIAKP